MMSNENVNTILTNQENLEISNKISQLLNTGLDKSTLIKCVELIEGGADPIALAEVIKELKSRQ